MDQPQPTEAPTAKPFQIGLALAGAISAGAYTAGVIDFLFQALSEWEDARRRTDTNVPQHRVVLKVMAGASAGAITGALGAISLARGLQPRRFDPGYYQTCYPDHYQSRQTIECVLPALRKTWVELPAMTSSDGIGGLLGADDVAAARAGNAPLLKSLLNASLLDDIKRIAIEPAQEPGTVMPPVPYIAKDLHVYLTVSNLRGIPFKVAFGRNSYGMQTMGDRIHYVVKDLGSTDLSEAGSWVELDSRLPISVTTLPQRRGDNLGAWDMYGDAALASGAYPIGLASRRLNFGWEQYANRSYPIPVTPGLQIQPNFPQTITGSFVFESVDGGLVNNDPFDYAQYALFGGPARAPERGDLVERAIVMVAPFPEPPEFLPEGSPSPSVASILRCLFPSLVNQARFRASELAPAVDERDFSRFLVAPLRRRPRTADPGGRETDVPLERYPIACGLLGGFGGFLDEKFRAHDFQLGRRNCQHFLRNSFTLPGNNVIVGRPDGDPNARIAVIPLVGAAEAPIPLPKWPQMSQTDYAHLCKRLKERLELVVPHFIEGQSRSKKFRLIMRSGWRLFRAHVVLFVQQTILADLVRRGQIEGRDPPVRFNAQGPSPTDVSAIMAELINPAYDRRTPDGIAKATRLPVNVVRQVLIALSNPDLPTEVRAWSTDDQYTLVTRKPGRFSRWWGTRTISRWWNAPTVS